MAEPQWMTVAARIGGVRYLVGGYLVQTKRDALRATEEDLVAMIPLEIIPNNGPELPSVVRLQGLNEEDWRPAEF